MRTVLMMFMLVAVILGGFVPSHAQDDVLENCPNDILEPRLIRGLQGRVLPGDANRLREEPTTDAETLGFIPGEATFMVFDGPVCADGFVWWQVGYDGQIGWTVEGNDEYWLEPVTDTLNISVDDVCYQWGATMGDDLTGKRLMLAKSPA